MRVENGLDVYTRGLGDSCFFLVENSSDTCYILLSATYIKFHLTTPASIKISVHVCPNALAVAIQ